ncbi:MAG: VWA domain-containing protein [Rhodobacteraceae bacterium]|nr:VWA domain-containing protein [Paracoccaceae bacterium]
MGGKNDKPTIGYKHYLGVHFVLCLSKIDKLLRIDVDKRVLWRGARSGGRIKVHKPELFESAIPEGGVSGNIDLLPGDADQQKNDYLVGLFKGVASAFRGVTSVVLRQVYLGNSPYLRSWAFKVQRIYESDGAPQWYPEKAGIQVSDMEVGDAAIYIAMDVSGSMAGARMQRQKDAIAGLIEEIREHSDAPNDIHIVTWNMAPVSLITRRDCGEADYDDLLAWVSALNNVTMGGTNFTAALSGMFEFYTGETYAANPAADIMAGSDGFGDTLGFDEFGSDGSSLKRRIVVFSTDGTPTFPETIGESIELLAQLENLEVFCVNIDDANTSYAELLDNTENDGVPVVNGANPDALKTAFTNIFSSGLDMNPAHILLEVVAARDTGGNGDASQIGDSFKVAADLFHAEGFGLSFLWKNTHSRATFKELVERHVDALVYEDRFTGKWEIKPIRADYDKATLPVFDKQNVIEWSNLSLPTDRAVLPNQVTIKYNDRTKDDTAALTVSNPARVAGAGAIINKPVEFEGIYSAELAARVASRELLVVSSLIRSGTIKVTVLPRNINVGSPLILDDPRFNIANMVARVTEIVDGDGRDNSALIHWVEDKFDLPSQAHVSVDVPITSPVTNYPTAAVHRLVEEAPYYELVYRIGQSETDTLLADDDTLGFLNVCCNSPTPDAINAKISVDDGAGFSVTGLTDFMVVAETLSALSRRADDTQLVVKKSADLTLVRIGSIASIGGEIVRVDHIAPVFDAFAIENAFTVTDDFADGAVLTLGRGCLDTVPQNHEAGAVVKFWGDVAASDRVEHFEAEPVSVKLLPKTNRGTLKVAAAPTDTVVFAQRAIRPYPPGDLRIEGGYGDVLAVGDLAITWVGRDRTLQTTSVFEDHSAGNIGPEAGVTYRVRISAVSSSGAELVELGNVDVGAATAFTFNQSEYQFNAFAAVDAFALDGAFEPILPLAASVIKIEVLSFRAGLQCWQVPYVLAPIFKPPSNLQIGSADEITFLAPSNLTITEII